MPAFSVLVEAARARAPQAALVLGSGMERIAQRVRPARAVPFGEVPGLPSPSVAGHPGRLMLGDWAGRRLVVFEGRLHHYEGHPWRAVTAPVQTAALLGARILVLTNAAGGIRDGFGPGELMAIRDHIDWTPLYWWRQPGPGGIGTARPAPYSPRLLELLGRAAQDRGIQLHEGIYAAVTGPNYESPAEIRALRSCGADAVGMSTAREAQAAWEAGMECVALSCITNRAAGLGTGPISHAEVLQAGAAASEQVAGLLERFLSLLG